ncbi:MAG: hypothetical protein JO069_16165 [Verrucomicrobia bacterium]|nr:hypothetical protein [Verrucomicrobiota bacterium]
MTKQEYSFLLQTLAEDERSAGLKIKAYCWAENQLAVILFLKNGHRVTFNTFAEFHRWYKQSPKLAQSRRSKALEDR